MEDYIPIHWTDFLMIFLVLSPLLFVFGVLVYEEVIF